MPTRRQGMERGGQFRNFIKLVQQRLGDFKIRAFLPFHRRSGFFNLNGFHHILFDFRFFCFYFIKVLKPDLPRGLHVDCLLDQDTVRIFEQCAFDKQKGAVLFEAMNHDHISTIDGIAWHLPLELFHNRASCDDFPQFGKFYLPFLFAGNKCIYFWISFNLHMAYLLNGVELVTAR